MIFGGFGGDDLVALPRWRFVLICVVGLLVVSLLLVFWFCWMLL